MSRHRLFQLVGVIACLTLLLWGASAQTATAVFEDGAVLAVEKTQVTLKKGEHVLFSMTVASGGDKAEIIISPVSKKQTAFLIAFRGTLLHRLMGVRKGDDVQVIWNAPVAYRGDMGELTATDVRLTDVDGDGVADMVKGTLFQRAHLCGQEDLPLLFRQKYDLKKKKFVSIQGRRSVKLKTSLEPNVDAENPPLTELQFLIADSVSSSVGDDQNPLLLTAPYSLVDGSSATGWSAGDGRGVGEFATFTTLSSTWKIQAIGLDVAAQEKKTENQKDGTTFAIPPSVIVSFDKVAYRLRLPETEGTHWFTLPTPLQSECVSLILEDPASSVRAPMALFEVRAQTEIHAPGGLEKLVRLLDDDDLGEQARVVLRSLGANAYESISKLWKTLSLSGRRRAVRLVADIAPKQGASLLVSALMIDDAFVRDVIISALQKSGGIGEAVLAKYFTNRSGVKFETSVGVLVEMNTERAFELLLEGVSAQSDAARKQVLMAAVEAISIDVASRAARVLQKAVAAKDKEDLQGMFDWLSIAVKESSAAEEAALMAREVYDTSEFQNRYRALRIVAAANDDFSIQFFADVAKSDNKFLRYESARALAAFGDDEHATAVLSALAADDEPLVQIEALTSLLKSKDLLKRSAVLAAIDNPWPEVRALAVLNSVHLREQKLPMVIKGLKDENYIVVNEALRVSSTLKDQGLDSFITKIMTSSQNAVLLERAAQVAGVRCQSNDATLDALYELLRVGAEPLANATEKTIAVSAARSLGQIGSTKAVSHLKKAREHSNLTTDKAIDSALVNAKEGCAAR